MNATMYFVKATFRLLSTYYIRSDVQDTTMPLKLTNLYHTKKLCLSVCVLLIPKYVIYNFTRNLFIYTLLHY